MKSLIQVSDYNISVKIHLSVAMRYRYFLTFSMVAFPRVVIQLEIV
jgi:hypothetical protein